MNKSALGTVLGVGLLSFIKRQSGSSIRLTRARFCDVSVSFEINIPINRSLKMTHQEEWDLEADLIRCGDDFGFEVFDYSVQNRIVDHFAYPPSDEWYDSIRFEASFDLDNLSATKTVNEVSQMVKDKIKEIISIIDEQVVAIDKSLKLTVRNSSSSRTSDPMEIYNVQLGDVIEYNWDRTNQPATVNVMVPIDNDYNHTYTFRIDVTPAQYKVVNAETGELYNVPKSRNPKLRRR